MLLCGRRRLLFWFQSSKERAEVNKANVTVIGTGTMTEDGGTIIRK